MLPEQQVPHGWEQVQQILVVQLGHSGDVIVTEPVLQTLRQARPSSKITLMTSLEGSQIAPWLPGETDIWVHQIDWRETAADGPEQEVRFIKTLQQQHFDAAVILTNEAQSPYPIAYCCYLAGIPLRVGSSKEFGGGVLSQWIKPLQDRTHPIDRHLFLLEAAGFTIADRHLALQVPLAIQPQVNQLLRRIEQFEDCWHETATECLKLIEQAMPITQFDQVSAPDIASIA